MVTKPPPPESVSAPLFQLEPPPSIRMGMLPITALAVETLPWLMVRSENTPCPLVFSVAPAIVKDSAVTAPAESVPPPVKVALPNVAAEAENVPETENVAKLKQIGRASCRERV